MIGNFHHNLCMSIEHKISRNINFTICVEECAVTMYQYKPYRNLCDMEDLYPDPNQLFPKCLRAYVSVFVKIEKRLKVIP